MAKKNRTPALPAQLGPATTDDMTAPAPTTTVDQAPVETTATLEALVYDKQIGIIGHLRSRLWDPNGTTKGEMLVRLQSLFPDRDPMGMATTVQIQLGRLQKKYGKIISVSVDKRGRVYGFEATLTVGGATPAAPAGEIEELETEAA